MKQLLPILILLLTVTTIQAQKVLIKDSVTDNFREAFGYQGEATAYTYDSSCRLIKTESLPSYRSFYSYYPNSNNLYQVTSQIYEGNALTDTLSWRNSYQLTYTYNEKNNITSSEFGYWDTLTGTFPGTSKDTFIYDLKDYKIKTINQSWDKTAMVWTDYIDTSFFYNGNGQTDSLIITSHPFEQKNVISFTYYNSGKLRSQTNHSYYSLPYDDSSYTLYFYDSTNHVSHDSIVTYSSNIGYGDTLVPTYIGTLTTYYDGDNYKIEEIGVVVESLLLSSGNYTKRYYTYGLCSSAFPLTFFAFSGHRQSNDALLTWQTAGEVNTFSFNIQRSIDGIHFITIGNVDALGNGSHNNYVYKDTSAFLISAPRLYYRLAEKDVDGSIHYSDVVTLDKIAEKLLMVVSPNPVTNAINLYSTAELTNTIVTVFDMRGRIMYSSKRNISAGSYTTIDVSGFAKGMYLVTVQSLSHKEQLKIIKE